MENKYSGIVFIPRTTGEAIINAYAMNAWNDTGKYIYFTEAGISVGYIPQMMEYTQIHLWM